MESYIPCIEDILNYWKICYETHEDRLIADLDKLTAKQKNILKMLAIDPTTEPMGHRFLNASKKSASSINQTIKSLLDKDMVFKIKKLDEAVPQWKLNQIRVLDPLLSFALKKYS